MSDFVRVRSAEGPETEYMVPRSLVDAHPDRYVVVAGEPVEAPKPAVKRSPRKPKKA